MIEINNKTRSKIDKNLINKIVLAFLRYFKVEKKELSIAFVGDTKIKKLNKIYRGYDKVTDVLSFEDEGDDDCLGEIIINYAQIKRQAFKYSSSVKSELTYILVHGLLHLLGHEDDTERGRDGMYELANDFLKNINLSKIK